MKQCMNFKFVILFALTLLVGSAVYGQDNVIDEQRTPQHWKQKAYLL